LGQYNNRAYNGLNQDATIKGLAGGYDPNGNMANDGVGVMTYDVYNRMLNVKGSGSNLKLIHDRLIVRYRFAA
jgi:hypothetical protein